MSFTLTIKLAWKNICGNRLRSGLTILGLVIGIASVILLVGIANGATKNISDEVSSLGTDIITLSIYDSEKALDYDEISDLKKIDKVKDVSPYTTISATLSKGGTKSKGTTLIGAGASYTEMMGYDLEYGRNLSPIDVKNCIKAVVIGNGIAEKFWKNKNPCGSTMKIDGDDYTVVGVLKSAGSSMGNNVDKSVIMPLPTAKFLGADTSITQMYLRADNEDSVDAATKNVKKYFKEVKHMGSDYMDVYSQKQMQKSMEKINKTLSLLLGGIASISLLVGGIGVMNVMLVSVTERTREIGIRKSLGAKKRDIMYQFLIESTVLSVFGGLIGIAFGLLLGRITILVGFYFAADIGTILLAFGVSVAVGLIFGIMPSYRAACLRPVEALRYE